MINVVSLFNIVTASQKKGRFPLRPNSPSIPFRFSLLLVGGGGGGTVTPSASDGAGSAGTLNAGVGCEDAGGVQVGAAGLPDPYSVVGGTLEW